MFSRRDFFKSLAASALACGVLPVGFPRDEYTNVLDFGYVPDTDHLLQLWQAKFYEEYKRDFEFFKGRQWADGQSVVLRDRDRIGHFAKIG